MNAGAESGVVYLVGAGPGDPGLLTLRAADLLRTADVILPDDLVSDDVLALASPTALIIPVGKRCGQPRITQAGIHDLMLHHAQAGNSVLRLKSGDPLVFGRIGEEMAALRAANIRFEIVPGISAAFAAAAAFQVPLTDRTHASRLILATAHHAAGKVDLARPWESSWTGTFPDDATLVLYMPGRDFVTLSGDLIRSGIPPQTPCLAVSKATRPDQHVCVTTVAGLVTAQVGLAPVLLLIGQATQFLGSNRDPLQSE